MRVHYNNNYKLTTSEAVSPRPRALRTTLQHYVIQLHGHCILLEELVSLKNVHGGLGCEGVHALSDLDYLASAFIY